MEREIKFRAWDANFQTMITPYCELIDGYFWGEDCTNTGYSIKHEHVMQYTGLKDKNGNGNDVFEGDIFEAIYKDCPDGFTILGKETTTITVKAVVVFKFGKFVIEMMHPQHKELVYSDLFEFLKNEQKVVIGNIYENPEMLR